MVLALLCLAARLASRACAPARGFGTRTLGVDFGLRRTGLAVSAGIAPLPIGIIDDQSANLTAVAAQVVRAARSEGASQLVLGMPYNSSGGEGEQAVATRRFGELLAREAAPRPVYLWDERFSSAEASMRANAGDGAAHGQSIDDVAAAIILEEFFEGDFASAELIAPPPEARAHARLVQPPPPPSHAEVRAAMMARAAAQSGGTSGGANGQGGRRRKKKR
ncbi:hypothetical protein EMIHUDRAFT_451280 [Emiliania huxleyi CCMP1516]|uniref:YqgF/RNase H-like domain-containing protein n=2 Tax=Emiliania huxleyi TaxID=2903 RepID=A0A0D3J602_EMIH1|nr:hypothetical protein EMIHUDRAFT_451280 [Emiliania huxleyi CCMP1516]EOD18937.1 hypothetical protein EMIHUDRAFT_451280 [Emiliania huxleyi CCMP1516]|eukprot:XP_005771366.1 hypothetical protein EMIHUDRAFT_451280 [Emiliania huxleyi CCMP1516]